MVTMRFISKAYPLTLILSCRNILPNLPSPSPRLIRLSLEKGGLFCVSRKVLKYKIEICIIFTIQCGWVYST